MGPISCEKFLPGPAWLLLSKTGPPFTSSLISVLSYVPGESTTVPGLNFSLAVVGAIGALEVLGGGGGVGGSVVAVFLVLNTMGGNGVGLLRLR